jgi:hypothetical protein
MTHVPVIDDEPVFHGLVARALEMLNFTISDAENRNLKTRLRPGEKSINATANVENKEKSFTAIVLS